MKFTEFHRKIQPRSSSDETLIYAYVRFRLLNFFVTHSPIVLFGENHLFHQKKLTIYSLKSGVLVHYPEKESLFFI